MYLEIATEEDKKMVENWEADADGILIFVCPYSNLALYIDSNVIDGFILCYCRIVDLSFDSQDTSNFYLANIHQTLSEPILSNISDPLPATGGASPPPFSPPTYAVWVNSFWFLSIVISLTCALLATSLQQWARRYLKVTQPCYSPHTYLA